MVIPTKVATRGRNCYPITPTSDNVTRMDTEIEKRFGRVVTDELHAQGRYQRELAEHLGTTQETVSRRLGGHFGINLGDAHQIAVFLDVPLTELIERSA